MCICNILLDFICKYNFSFLIKKCWISLDTINFLPLLYPLFLFFVMKFLFNFATSAYLGFGSFCSYLIFANIPFVSLINFAISQAIFSGILLTFISFFIYCYCGYLAFFHHPISFLLILGSPYALRIFAFRFITDWWPFLSYLTLAFISFFSYSM